MVRWWGCKVLRDLVIMMVSPPFLFYNKDTTHIPPQLMVLLVRPGPRQWGRCPGPHLIFWCPFPPMQLPFM